MPEKLMPAKEQVRLGAYSRRSFQHQYRLAARKGMDARWAWACDDPRSLEPFGLKLMTLTLFRASSPAAADQAGRARAPEAG
jgi:hypothetical protein